jgi:hypothetical protein
LKALLKRIEETKEKMRRCNEESKIRQKIKGERNQRGQKGRSREAKGQKERKKKGKPVEKREAKRIEKSRNISFKRL